MREKKNWVDKNALNSYYDNTSLKENIAQMLFKIPKGYFGRIERFQN